MLTARGEEGDRVRGLATGADDYVVKPFSVPELLARVRALLRRAKPAKCRDAADGGDIELDRETRRVRRAGSELHLGPTEFRLLEFLMQSPGRVFSREQLLDGVWGRDVYIDERTVDVHVGRLRKALNRARGPDPIRTVRGAGYAFDETFMSGTGTEPNHQLCGTGTCVAISLPTDWTASLPTRRDYILLLSEPVREHIESNQAFVMQG